MILEDSMRESFVDCPECKEKKMVVPGMVFYAVGQTSPNCTVQGQCLGCKKEVYIQTTILKLPEELWPIDDAVIDDGSKMKH